MMDAMSGTKERDEAIAQVDANADPVWMQRALRAIYEVAQEKPMFTTDDVWVKMSAAGKAIEPRAMGAAMVRAVRASYCSGTTTYVASMRPECHRRPVKMWKSLIWKGLAQPRQVTVPAVV